MKTWEKPELKELKAACTQEKAGVPGVDEYMEEIIIGGELVEMGSCP